MKGNWLVFAVFLSLFVSVVNGLTNDFLNRKCNSELHVAQSHRLESSDALYYEPDLSCYFTVTVDAGKRVFLISRIFELESKVSGACVDFVNIHDGISVASSTINASPLCGVIYRTTYLSTSNAMTVYFETDKTGARHGFDYVFVAVTTGTCNSGQFACNTTGVCIPEDLYCSTQDECADNSDETGCVYDFPDGVELDPNAALIIGLCVGLFVALVVASLFGYFCYRHHIRWRFFMRRPLTVDEVVHEETTHYNAYPVTKVYYKERFQDMYIDAKGPPVYHGAVATHITKRDSATASQVSSDVVSAEDLSTSTRKDSIYA